MSRLALERVERLAAVVGERDAERALLELHLDDAPDVRLVVGDEHVAHGGLGHRQVGRELRWRGTGRSASGRAASSERPEPGAA